MWINILKKLGLLENFAKLHKNIRTINEKLLEKQLAYILCNNNNNNNKTTLNRVWQVRMIPYIKITFTYVTSKIVNYTFHLKNPLQ